MILELDADVKSPDRVLDEVRSEVDRIPSFPVEAEDPEIRRVTARRSAIRVGVLAPESHAVEWSGAEELALREYAERVRDDLLQLDGVTQVDFIGARDYQIDVEIRRTNAPRSYKLSPERRCERSFVERTTRCLRGTIRSESQEVLLVRGDNRRTDGQGDRRITADY